MKAVIQRVIGAKLRIDSHIHSQFDGVGLLVLLGVSVFDTEENIDKDIEWLVNKLVKLRIFRDENQQMNRSLLDVNGSIMVVSQFTLFASTKRGNRPSFTNSASSEIAKPIYEKFIKKLEHKIQQKVATGIFGADMQLDFVNDGPVTVVIDTLHKE